MKTKKYMKYLLVATLAVLTLIASACATPDSGANKRMTEEEARQIAEDFVRNSPTFTFDGIEDTLELVGTLYPDIENSWQFVFQFESRQAGYGDRTGQMLLQVITPHEAVITIEEGKVKSALMDEKWDMINQQMVNNEMTEGMARNFVEQYVRNSSTFRFDGTEDSLKLVETLYSDIEETWTFVFQFESRHAGYGDRTGQMLAQVITPHEAIVTVGQHKAKPAIFEVKSAIMDGKWDMANQKMLNG